MKLLLIFCVLNVVNVILQTVKSVCTIKCGKWVASLVNAIAYGLYTIVIVYTMCDLPLFLKAIVVALANLIGVFIVKFFEEKNQKEKLWRIEATVKDTLLVDVTQLIEKAKIGYSIISISNSNYYMLAIYCNTKNDSRAIRQILKKYKVKYFVSESKYL